jgi:hypothetical protein
LPSFFQKYPRFGDKREKNRDFSQIRIGYWRGIMNSLSGNRQIGGAQRI